MSKQKFDPVQMLGTKQYSIGVKTISGRQPMSISKCISTKAKSFVCEISSIQVIFNCYQNGPQV